MKQCSKGSNSRNLIADLYGEEEFSDESSESECDLFEDEYDDDFKSAKMLEVERVINSNETILSKLVVLKDHGCVEFKFPDVHADLPSLLRNLYIAGVIDIKGKWRKDTKLFVTILGDMIDRGDYSIETVLYLLDLQKQAKENGDKLELLIGNHEQAILDRINLSPVGFEDCKHSLLPIKKNAIRKGEYTLMEQWEKLAKILRENIDNKNIILASCGQGAWISHSELTKEMLKETLKLFKKQKCNEEIEEFEKSNNRKMKYKDIFELMKRKNITYIDVAECLNVGLRNHHNKSRNEKYRENIIHLPDLMIKLSNNNIVNNRDNPRNVKGISDPDRSISDRADKIVQIVGHTKTLSDEFKLNLPKHKICRIHHTIFTDCSNKGFVGITKDRKVIKFENNADLGHGRGFEKFEMLTLGNSELFGNKSDDSCIRQIQPEKTKTEFQPKKTEFQPRTKMGMMGFF